MSSIITETPAELAFISALEHLQNVNYLHVCSLALLLYEFCINLNLEIQFIWKSSWSAMKILYLLSRYVAFADTTVVVLGHFLPHQSPKACHNQINAVTWLIMLGMGIAEIILTLRTWAVWGKKRWLTISLPIFYLVLWISACVAAGVAVNTLTYEFQGLMERGCLVTGGDTTLVTIDWSLLFIYDFVNMTLMIIPAYRLFREAGGSEMTKAVVKDGLIFYVFIFVVSFANLVVALALSPDYFNIILILGRVIHSILACRVVLHVRAWERKEQTLVFQTLPHN